MPQNLKVFHHKQFFTVEAENSIPMLLIGMVVIQKLDELLILYNLRS